MGVPEEIFTIRDAPEPISQPVSVDMSVEQASNTDSKSGWARLHDRSVAFCSSAVLHIWLVALFGFLVFPVFRKPERFAVDTTVRFESELIQEDLVEIPVELPEVSAAPNETQVVSEPIPVETSETELAPTETIEAVTPVEIRSDTPQVISSVRDLSDEQLGTIIGNRRSRAGGQVGDVTISLIWQSRDDLDLHVWTPSGEKVWFGHKRSPYGHLDVDANIIPTDDEPIENYFEPHARQGYYRFAINLYRERTATPIAYTVGVWIYGKPKFFRGEISSGMKTVAGFRLDGQTVNWADSVEADQIAVQEELKALRHKLNQFSKQRVTSRRLLLEFIEKYPKSPEAIEAREDLKHLR